MAEASAQKSPSVKPSTLLRLESGKNNPTVELADNLFAVETQAVKEYGVYNSDDYAGWRKKNGFGNINSSSIGKQASDLRKRLKSENISMEDIQAASAFIKKYHSPLVGLSKREAKMFYEEMGKAKRKLPFHRKSSLINIADKSARAKRKEEDK